MVKRTIIAYIALLLAVVVVIGLAGSVTVAVGIGVVGLLGPPIFYYRWNETRPLSAQRSRR